MIEHLDRQRYERSEGSEETSPVYRNGHGKPRQQALYVLRVGHHGNSLLGVGGLGLLSEGTHDSLNLRLEQLGIGVPAGEIRAEAVSEVTRELARVVQEEVVVEENGQDYLAAAELLLLEGNP